MELIEVASQIAQSQCSTAHISEATGVSKSRVYRLMRGEHYKMSVTEFDSFLKNGFIVDKTKQAKADDKNNRTKILNKVKDYSNMIAHYNETGNILRLGDAIREFNKWTNLLTVK